MKLSFIVAVGALFMSISGWTAAAEEPAPACAKDQDAHEGVCYPKCQDGFKAEGVLCKQICPERTQDAGNHCLSGPAQFRKKVYERAAAGSAPKQQ